MALFVLLDEGQYGFGGKGLVHDDLTVGVEDNHSRSAVYVVGLLVVDVDIRATDVDEG